MSAGIYERIRYDAEALTDFAEGLLLAAGLQQAAARDVAEVLVEGDLLGHDTHGLQLLAPYLAELDKGTMTRIGEPEVVNQRASVATWDGHRLPGPWLVRRAGAQCSGASSSRPRTCSSMWVSAAGSTGRTK